jgi:hypothetical protein
VKQRRRVSLKKVPCKCVISGNASEGLISLEGFDIENTNVGDRQKAQLQIHNQLWISGHPHLTEQKNST